MSALERRPVRVRGRWVVVIVDADRAQCKVLCRPGRGRGLAYYVNGCCDSSVAYAAEYARDFGYSYRSRFAAEGEDVPS